MDKTNRALFVLFSVLSLVHFIILPLGDTVAFSLYAVILLFFTRLRIENLVYCILFLLPLENFFKFNEGTISFVTVFLAITLIIISLKLFKCISINNVLFTFSIFSVMLLRVFFLDNSNNIIIFRFLVNFNIILILLNYSKKFLVKTLYKGIWFYIYGTIVLLVLTVLNFFSKYGVSAYLSSRMYGFNGDDPNYISSYVCISIVFLLFKICQRVNTLQNGLLSMVLFIGGLLTQSRGFIIGLIPGILYFIKVLTYKFKTRSMLVTLMLISVFSIMQRDFIFTILEQLYYRTLSGDDISSGRLEIWGRYITYLCENPFQLLWGNVHLFNDYHRAHNIFIGAMTEEGILIFLIEIIFYVYIYMRLKIKRFSKEGLVMLITILLVYQFINATLLNVFLYSIIMTMSYVKEHELH